MTSLSRAKVQLREAVSSIPVVLRWALVATLALYLINFGLLAFLIGPFDYDHLSAYYELAWRFWRSSPGLPHFNPFLCGGRTLGADPQLPIFNPLTALVPLLGPTVLIKWEMLAQLAMGAWALVRMLATLGVSRAGRAWGLFLFLAGGAVVARYMVGHVTLGFYILFPLFLHLSYRLESAKGAERARVLSMYFVAFAYAGAYKPNFLIYAVPTLLLEAVVRASVARRPRVVVDFACATIVCGLVNAVSYLPAQSYFSAFPRVDAATEPQVVALYAFFANLLLPLKAIPKAFYGEGFYQRHEYNLFVGPVALWFAWLGLRRLREIPRDKAIALVVFGLASIWIGLGRPSDSVSPFFPFTWLHAAWPGFASVRVPPRFWFGAGLVVLTLSAMGFRAPNSRRGWAMLVVLGILPLWGQATVNLFKTSVQAHGTQWTPERAYPQEVFIEKSTPDFPYAAIRQGKSVYECVFNIENYRANDLVPGDLLNVTTSAPAKSSARWLAWNRIALRAQAPTPFTLTLNLGHFPFWRFDGSGGRIVSKLRAPLAIHSDTGNLAGELVFEQPWIKPAILLSATSLFGLVAFVGLSFRRRRLLKIGLTGGIASGKSLAAEVFREKGIRVVDLDQVGRELTASDPELIRAVVDLLGDDTRAGSGLNRRRIRELVFDNPEKRRALEALMHPRIRAAFEKACEETEARGERAIVCEAALLVEGGYFQTLDTLVVITAPEADRLRRLQARDGIDLALATSMLRAQSDDATKLQHANFHLKNDGTKEALRVQIEALLKVWKLA